MKITHLFIALFLIILLCLPIYTLHAQENYEIRSITFNGNAMFSSTTLSEQMAMFGTGQFRKLILRKKSYLYSKESMKNDIERLVRFYQREGFLHIKIKEPGLEPNHKKKTVKLIFHISEGDPILVRKADFRLIADSTGSAEELQAIINRVRPALALVKNKRFRDQALQTDQELLTSKFCNAGYPYIKIFPELNVAESESLVDITWLIESGPQCVFGAVAISGNQHVSSDLIRKQLAFNNGQVYRQKLIDKSQQQVFALGMFQIATVKALLKQQKENVIPVRIVLKEAPRLTTKFGIGYGTEDKVRIFIDLRRLGFLGGARRLNLNLKHSAIEPYNISLKLTQPAFITPGLTFILNPFIRRQEEPGFTLKRAGASASIMHRLTRHSSGSVTYAFERVDLDTSSTGLEQMNAKKKSGLYNKSSIILGLTRNSSSPLFSPTGGMFSSLIFKISGLGFNSDYHFTKFLMDVRRYSKFTGITFAYRMKIGGIKSYDANGLIPVEERFFAGGSASVRGWGFQRLGPVDANDIPTGGSSLLEGSLELRYPIIGPFSGAVFFDVGNLWSASYTYKLDELCYSAGLGLRFDTPIGPIRLDVAQPVFNEDKKVQFHISVGQAF